MILIFKDFENIYNIQFFQLILSTDLLIWLSDVLYKYVTMN